MIKNLVSIVAMTTMIFSATAIADKQSHPHHMHHSQLEVNAMEQIPTIEIKMHPDAMSGWNLEVITENFEFAPNLVNQAHKMGKGHAHLYINGKKIGRLYANWRHITGLSQGKHTIKVTLNSNDHQDYANNGEVIGAELEIIQK